MMKNNYKKTLNLPRTKFPMKANLVNREPEILAYWRKIDLNERLAAPRDGGPVFILHDGPPYANGDIHVGHTLNKVLKDIIVKFKNMSGFYAPYVPGWDCHGQPIEHEVVKRLGPKAAEISQIELRRLCRDYALKYVDRQRGQFIRLGVTGTWEHPYLTLNKSYEAANVRVFNQLYQEGLIYRGQKPIHWCWSCRTALAEAEIEYGDELSPSIYLKFPVVERLSSPLNDVDGEVSLLVWTTTPWTLPANVAVALRPDAVYTAVSVNNDVLVVAEERLAALKEKLGGDWRPLKTFKGSEISGISCRRPIFADKESRVVTAEYVALDQGTGCVHIAPGHGADDYAVGIVNDLPAPMPVDDDGLFTGEAGVYRGLHIFAANERIIADLKKNGILIFTEEISHSYPHCWRCKKPVIFRATKQWFISMDNKDLRGRALSAVNEVSWLPPGSVNRITAMVEDRPDWCISRQRSWGVPIPVFYCNDCDAVLAEPKVLKYVEDIFTAEGADSWFERPVGEMLPPGTACPECGGKNIRRESDILDVWFESGVSHEAVLKTRKELKWPADLYLEGSDQHRGWFQSSLFTAVGVENKAPYRQVLTHGFLVDGEGRKMSKSLGNVIDPLKVIERSGSDILRLWVSSADYHSDIAVSDEILTRITDAYRRLRNTFRFILGNISDFDNTRHKIAYRDMTSIDKWALMRLQQVIDTAKSAYEKYQFHQVYQAVYSFCNMDLSAFYFDVLKDRLYTAAAGSRERRSAQTVLVEILINLLKITAPILVFTTEEAWGMLPENLRDADSVHLSVMPESEADYLDNKLEQDWARLRQLRGEVTKAIEEARNNGVVNASLEAKVILRAPESLSELINDYKDELASIFIVSQVKLETREGADWWRSGDVNGLAVKVERADGEKCARCWNWSTEIGTDKDYPDICPRCRRVVSALKS